MVTLVVKMRLDIPAIGSLKEKRRILKSMITRLRNDFNISIAEVDLQDQIRAAVLGAAVISNSSAFCHQVMAKVIARVESSHEVILADYLTETY
ncbi:MAG TPA: DUF503 domain-containing protein [candidate division Zixibacteria bacterium]|nr:DUF503 domain-containing protein [candidate division Zixibacteria bacterium]MDM7973096.1 DUF503 domain-containing protein [candidate division Zixibacteria bacterium]HOD67703.1 DUF503 domain-containing protein [candidate division Zixibacteria bacterium]HOZ08436.1 DUF503 domain-containing protein [candidate division Zixibacteria bacterium]HPI32892.1 DUF503 domain-containing protein [candidate division Zixibacteria bacterium]